MRQTLGLCITVSCFEDIPPHQRGSGFFVPQESCIWEHTEPLFFPSLFAFGGPFFPLWLTVWQAGPWWGNFPDFTLRSLGLTVLHHSEHNGDGLMAGDYDLEGLLPP